MTPYYADDWLTVYHGDCRAVMAEMEPESVHCVVTSPPYWGLRDYGTATWEGGEPGCDHVDPGLSNPVIGSKSTLHGGIENILAAQTAGARASKTCRKCGATRIDAQLGLEPTPEEYVANLVAVFREVKRVLRADGTVWLNLGDTFAAGHSDWSRWKGGQTFKEDRRVSLKARAGLKPKDLVGIPWRVAFALQADGWYLRSDIIWSKPNPMPESVTDRPTKSHEYLFLLAKSARYYFDADAVRETPTGHAQGTKGVGEWNKLPDETTNGRGASTLHAIDPAGRNIRSVWTVATAPYPGAHFATFPPKLIEPCIKAGTSERGVCPECGAPWERVVERSNTEPYRAGEWKATGEDHRNDINRKGGFYTVNTPTGWRPSCAHISPLPPRPAVVLDPFAGSGTTGLVAQSLSRRAVLIDLSLDYLGQLMGRNADIPLGLGA